MNGKENGLIDKILDTKLKYRDLSLEHWLKSEVFTWQWWIGFAFSIIPLIVWWKLVDRKRILEITVFGFMVNVFATILDVTGSEFVLWAYPIRVIPQIPLLIPVDFILLPIVYMLIYQYFTKWKGFLISSTITAAVLSFVVEPAVAMIGQYKLIHWEYIYSFPIYILIVIICKALTKTLLSKQASGT